MLRRPLPVLVAVGALAALTIATACSSRSSSTPSTTASSTATTGRVRPKGFATVELQVRKADGTLCRLCLYLARAHVDQQRGLMGVTDLDGRDGMVFPFDPPSVEQFWMRSTVMPLTAVWFDAQGRFLESDDMTPCPDGAPSCPTWGSPVAASAVIEFPRGKAAELGIGAGSQLVSGWSSFPVSTDPAFVCPVSGAGA